MHDGHSPFTWFIYMYYFLIAYSLLHLLTGIRIMSGLAKFFAYIMVIIFTAIVAALLVAVYNLEKVDIFIDIFEFMIKYSIPMGVMGINFLRKIWEKDTQDCQTNSSYYSMPYDPRVTVTHLYKQNQLNQNN